MANETEERDRKKTRQEEDTKGINKGTETKNDE